MASLEAQIESLLLVSNRPLTVRELAGHCEAKLEDAEQAVRALAQAFAGRPRAGMIILRSGQHVQLATAGDCAAAVQRFLKEETAGELTRAQLETLTIVAYRGPVSRAELEQIRGVNCAIILRNLQVRGLLEPAAERASIPKYLVSLDFLKALGLARVEMLPDYERLHGLEVFNRLSETPPSAA